MFAIEAILHPTDFSPSARAAFGYALQMTRRYGATLHILNAAPRLGEDPIRSAYELGAGEVSIYKKARDEAQQMIAALIEEAKAEDVDVVRAHERGLAAGPVILNYAEKRSVDLIVMGTHGRRGVKRFLLGSVAEEVVRRATCSVLTVRAVGETVADSPAIRRILVPVDLSAFTVPLFRIAKDVAAAFEAHIDLLHAVEPLPFPVPLIGGLTLHDLVSDPVGRVEEQLAHLIKTTEGPAVTTDAHVEEGHAADVIVGQAQVRESDLIVIASHGLSGLEGLLLGSVTTRVVRRTKCPVLVVRIGPEEEIGDMEQSQTTSQ